MMKLINLEAQTFYIKFNYILMFILNFKDTQHPEIIICDFEMNHLLVSILPPLPPNTTDR